LSISIKFCKILYLLEDVNVGEHYDGVDDCLLNSTQVGWCDNFGAQKWPLVSK